MSDFSRLRGNERYEVCGDESRGSAAARNGGFFHGRGFAPRRNGGLMQFFASAVTTLQTLVVALGAGLAVWGVVNLLEATARITQRPKARASSSSWLIRCNKSGERKSTIQTEPAV